MSTHTTYFCDECNSDHDIQHGDDEGHAINYEYPAFDGWAVFQRPYTASGGYKSTEEFHICAHCLADPEFNPEGYGSVPEWDTQSCENVEKGRRHAEAFTWAQEHLGTPDTRWSTIRGVLQVFGGGSYWTGPKMHDGRFSTSDRVPMAQQVR